MCLFQLGAVLESTELAGKADSDEITSDLAEVDAQGSSTLTNPFREQEQGPRVNGLTQTEYYSSNTSKNLQASGSSMLFYGEIGLSFLFLALGAIIMCVSCCVKGSAKTGTLMAGGIIMGIALCVFAHAIHLMYWNPNKAPTNVEPAGRSISLPQYPSY